MKIFKGVPKKRVFIDILFSCIWALLNAMFTNLLADMVCKIVNGTEIINIAIFFICYIIIWELVEFGADVYSTITSGVIECNINKFYFNKLYKIKPVVLKDNNTGYISGILNKLVIRQEQAYRQLVLHTPICMVYICYFAFKMCEYHWALGLLLIFITLLGNGFRFAIGKISEKYSADLTHAEGTRNKLIVDIVSNINTVQKMKSIDFMNSCINKENDNCLKKNKEVGNI